MAEFKRLVQHVRSFLVEAADNPDSQNDAFMHLMHPVFKPVSIFRPLIRPVAEFKEFEQRFKYG